MQRHRTCPVGRGQCDCAGSLDLETIEVSIAVSIEPAYQGGIKLCLVKTHIIDLPVEVSRSTWAISSNNKVVTWSMYLLK